MQSKEPEQIDLKAIIPFLDPEEGIILFSELYMKHFMKDGLRRFQKRILRCRDKQVVLRIGRRSGKTHVLSIKAVYECMANENFRVLVITPTEEQGKLIFDMIVNKILKASPELASCVDRTITSPGKIYFTSGSTIFFFTAGTTTGRGAMSVRGQGADLVIIDEADYLNAADLESILALKIEHRNVVMWASSTPTGKRGYYYRWCTDKKSGWTEFHYPAPEANPYWDDEMDMMAKREYMNPDAYSREILAEFGTEEAGVFNKVKLDLCFNEGEDFYNNPPLYMPYYGYYTSPVGTGIRTIGVDWDKYGAPTNIVILEMLEDGRMMVMNRVQIPQSEFTLTNAVNKIIELNKIWNPMYIYIDRGFGEFQAEVLKMHGKNDKSSHLDKILRPIAFGSKINFVDPVTKSIEKKDAKHLMVNLLQRSIEECRIIFNPKDEVMRTQFTNYHIERLGSSGKPIFAHKDDHSVDATMLAHLGLIENFDALFKLDNKIKLKFNKLFDMKRNTRKVPLSAIADERISNFFTDRKPARGTSPLKRFITISRKDRTISSRNGWAKTL